MSLVDDLIAARALIAVPKDWGKGPDGINSPGPDVLCAYNAVCVIGFGSSRDWYAPKALERELPEGPWANAPLPVAAFNDAPETTHADIMALFDRAIAAAKLLPEKEVNRG